MCAAANIPLSKTDHPEVRKFLHKHVTNGGAIPSAQQLHRLYLPREYSDREQDIKKALEGKYIALMLDEASDDVGRYVLNVLASPLETNEEGNLPSFLLDTVFLEQTNNTTVAQAIVKTLTHYEVDFNNVCILNTDNAAYMKKAFATGLRAILPNCVHVTCMSHIMNLLGDAFKKPFKIVTKFVKAFNAQFWHAGARKRRYLRHLKDMRPNKAAKFPPNPVGTRWNCWYEAAAYHVDHLDVYDNFIKKELDLTTTPPDSLVLLHEMIEDESTLRQLKAQLKFVVKKSEPFVTMTDQFQSQKPMAMKAWSSLEELEFFFASGKISMAEAEQYFPDDKTGKERNDLHSLFGEAYKSAADKLQKYMSPEGQPGIDFLKAVQIFNPKLVLLLSSDLALYDSIPGMQDVPEEEFQRFLSMLAPQAVRASLTGDMDLSFFWKSVSTRVPSLAEVALRYVSAICTSADVERSFSLYKLLLNCRRRSLSEMNIKSLLFLYYNNFADQDFLN